MDYSKFISRKGKRMEPNLIREIGGMYLKDPELITLASGLPNAAIFPFEEIDVTYKDGIRHELTGNELDTALQYGLSEGYTPLVNLWQEHQNRWHSPPRQDWGCAVTSGSQEAATRILDLLIDEGDPAMVQVPAYTATLGVFHSLAPEFIGIEQDADGIVPEGIQKICEAREKDGLRQPKVLFVNPTGSNPTGAVLTEERRRQVYALAQKYDFLIIEDDPYYFVNFLDYKPTSFLSLDTDGRVIRFDSFSKIFSAGLRIGIVTAHKDILTKLMLFVECSTLHASSLSQVLTYKLLDTWSPEKFEEHLKEVGSFYRRRRDVMVSLAEKHFTGLAEWSIPKAGLFLWIKIPAVDDVFDLVVTEFIANGVLVLPGHAFKYDSKIPDQHLRLSYSYSPAQDVDKGFSIIADLIRKHIAKKSNGINQ